MNTKRTNPHCRPGTTEAMERLAADNESLRATKDEAVALVYEGNEIIKEAMEEIQRLNRELEATESLAIIQCKAISDAMEYAIDQVGSDASADDCVDAMCEYLEQVSEGKFPTVGSTGNTWRSIRAAGAREALQRALYPPSFSDTVVRVDRLLEVIADMEKCDELS